MTKQQTVDATEPNCFNKQKCKPLIYKEKIVIGYCVDENGNVWSTKRSEPRKMRHHTAAGQYPVTEISVEGKRITVRMHRLVCESYHKFTKPKSVNKKEWDITPDSVKKIVKQSYEVNHKDHNRLNFHPDNLEWVTGGENKEKYQKYRSKKSLESSSAE